MDISFLIVTKNRVEELEITLNYLMTTCDFKKHEILVYIDCCAATEKLRTKFNLVKWFSGAYEISASPARAFLYKEAKGKILVGLDDDAHPLGTNYLSEITKVFESDLKIGIIAFQEIRGVFQSDEEALQHASKKTERYPTNDFVGCGFAIRRSVYLETNGFPVWMDIYGEEGCLAMEVLDLGYTIFYDNTIKVNHRVDRLKRIHQKKNYFRFEKQLLNSAFYFLVYYKNPTYRIAKLFFHNFRKYALKDGLYFKLFWKAFFQFVFGFFSVLKYRKPIKTETLITIKQLQGIKYT